MRQLCVGWLFLSAACVAAAAGGDEAERSAWSTEHFSDPDVPKKPEGTCPIDHTRLLSPSTACCYQKLVQDSGCCMDTRFRKEVKFQAIRRPGTEWQCDKKCFDSEHGRRGDDLLVIPPGATCSTPRVLYIHGGSWMYGSPRASGYAQFGSKMAVATGAVIFLIDYPLVPVGTFHSILEASVTALQWLAHNGPEKDCPHDNDVPLFVGGDSSGGGSALSLVMKLQAEPHLLRGRHLAGAFLFSPWTNLMCNTPEYYTNAFAKIQSPQTFKDLTPLQEFVGDIIFQAVTTTNAAEFSGNALEYVGYNSSLQTDPIASPYFAPPELFSGRHMPALHIAVGASESILGDSTRVAYAAAKGGADVTVEIYNGMWHVFPMYSEGCGSGTELWHGANAINSTGNFLRATIAAGGKKTPLLDGEENFPKLHYLYDPMVDVFSRVGELMPHTSGMWAQNRYKTVMKGLSKEPWWAVVSSLGGSAFVIFISGVLVGGLLDFGGREAYSRARRVAEYRRKCVEVPIGYVNLDALMQAQGGGSAPKGENQPQKSFLYDFMMGVPEEDVQSAWRGATARAKQSDLGRTHSEQIEAARAENAAWRRMGMPGYVPPPEVPAPEEKQLPPREAMESGAATSVLIKEVEAAGVSDSWTLATAEAKDGSDIEAARRENLAWRMQNMREASKS